MDAEQQALLKQISQPDESEIKSLFSGKDPVLIFHGETYFKGNVLESKK